LELKYNEQNLIKLVRTIPTIAVVIFSILATYFMIQDQINQYNKDIKYTKETFISEQKQIIKNEVLRVTRQIQYQKDFAEENLKKNLEDKTNMAYNIAVNIYNENKSKTKDEIKKLIKDAIRTIRFNDGRGYFFIYTMDGKNILLPPSPKMEDTNMWNLQDKKGLYTIRELSKISKNNGKGFLDWYWYKPNNNKKMYKKIGFVKHIKQLNWFIGTGEYTEDFEEEIKEKLIKEIQQIRYGKNGYIFLHQYDGLCLSHVKTKNIGKYRLGVKDKKGNFIIKDIIDVAKNGNGFLEYIGTIKPTTGLPSKKISYITGFDDWKWQIGTGTYITDIDSVLIQKENEFIDKLLQTIFTIVIASVVLTLLLIFITRKFSKKIENEFIQYKQSLAEQVVKNRKIEKQLFKSEKMASMGEMIGNIAHQWRQPLSVISTGATGMKMQKEYGNLSDEQFNKTCDAINVNAQYLSQTIDDFKNFIKGDRTCKTFVLKYSIKSFLSLVEGNIKNNNINIVLQLEEDIEINGYQNELIQCFINIFNNAKDALLENKTKHKTIFISSSIENDKAIIKIKDNAGGIQEDILPRIFEPYFTTKHQSQGTGLGLHMTYNLIVDGMGGTVEAHNVEYEYDDKNYTGAEFIISLPVS